MTYPLVINISQYASHQFNQEDQQEEAEILWIRGGQRGQRESGAMWNLIWKSCSHISSQCKTSVNANKDGNTTQDPKKNHSDMFFWASQNLPCCFKSFIYHLYIISELTLKDLGKNNWIEEYNHHHNMNTTLYY